MRIDGIVGKARAVVESCQTMQHLEGAENYIDNAQIAVANSEKGLVAEVLLDCLDEQREIVEWKRVAIRNKMKELDNAGVLHMWQDQTH